MDGPAAVTRSFPSLVVRQHATRVLAEPRVAWSGCVEDGDNLARLRVPDPVSLGCNGEVVRLDLTADSVRINERPVLAERLSSEEIRKA